jgi:acetyl/propionyl-CoA carboxylase alpha subunit
LKEVIEAIYSPCCGKIETLFVNRDSYVYEWEKLMLIHTTDNDLVEVRAGVSGHVVSLEVIEKQSITNETLLIKVKDDLLITGSE